MKEEKCIILDYLATGYADRRHPEPIAQAMGTDYFSLLELIPADGVKLEQGDAVSISKDDRNKIKFIRGSIRYSDLTSHAKNVLPSIVEKIVKENEQRFLTFFNTAGLITPRMHKIQLLPGVGKKHLVDLIDERRKKPFESFADILARVKLFPDPAKVIVRRVIQEIEGNEKYQLFIPQKKPFAY